MYLLRVLPGGLPSGCHCRGEREGRVHTTSSSQLLLIPLTCCYSVLHNFHCSTQCNPPPPIPPLLTTPQSSPLTSVCMCVCYQCRDIRVLFNPLMCIIDLPTSAHLLRRDLTLSTQPKPTRSCSTTRRSCLAMVTGGRRR